MVNSKGVNSWSKIHWVKQLKIWSWSQCRFRQIWGYKSTNTFKIPAIKQIVVTSSIFLCLSDHRPIYVGDFALHSPKKQHWEGNRPLWWPGDSMDGRRSQVAHRSIHWLRSPIKLFLQPVLLRVSYTHSYWGAPVVCRPRRLLCRPRKSRHTQYPRHLRYTLPLSPHTQWYLLPVSRLRYYSWPWGLSERVVTRSKNYPKQ